MDVVLVGDRNDAVLGLRSDKQVVGERRAKGGNTPAAQILERTVASGVTLAYGEDLAKLEIGDGDGQAGAARCAILDATQTDVEVAASRRRVEARESDLHEARYAAEPFGEQLRDVDVETDDAGWIGGVGLNEGRTAFGVAAPAQLRSWLRTGHRGSKRKTHEPQDTRQRAVH
jgi:hypothetical protein